MDTMRKQEFTQQAKDILTMNIVEHEKLIRLTELLGDYAFDALLCEDFGCTANAQYCSAHGSTVCEECVGDDAALCDECVEERVARALQDAEEKKELSA